MSSKEKLPSPWHPKEETSILRYHTPHVLISLRIWSLYWKWIWFSLFNYHKKINISQSYYIRKENPFDFMKQTIFWGIFFLAKGFFKYENDRNKNIIKNHFSFYDTLFIIHWIWNPFWNFIVLPSYVFLKLHFITKWTWKFSFTF